MNLRTIALTIAAALMLGVFAMAAPGQATHAIQITDGPRVEGTGDTWAVIAWTTNAGGSSIVHYGTDTNNLSQRAEQDYQGEKVRSGKVTHRVHVKNLQPNTTYYFRVDSGQGSGTGTQAQSSIMNFRTKGPGAGGSASNTAGGAYQNAGYQQGTQAVQITDGPRLEGTGDTWARIAWTTNAGSGSTVRYGTDPNNLSQVAQSPYAGEKIHSGRVTHRVEVRGLQPNTTYYYIVDSTQGSGTGTQTQSSVQTFHTNAAGQASSPGASQTYEQTYGGNTSPYSASSSPYSTPGGAVQIVDGPRLESVASNSATISWTTNGAGISVIRYGNNPSALTQTAQGATMAASSGQFAHRVTISNLQPHTTYYFVVDSGQGGAAGPQSQSSVIPFTTR